MLPIFLIQTHTVCLWQDTSTHEILNNWTPYDTLTLRYCTISYFIVSAIPLSLSFYHSLSLLDLPWFIFLWFSSLVTPTAAGLAICFIQSHSGVFPFSADGSSSSNSSSSNCKCLLFHICFIYLKWSSRRNFNGGTTYVLQPNLPEWW